MLDTGVPASMCQDMFVCHVNDYLNSLQNIANTFKLCYGT